MLKLLFIIFYEPKTYLSHIKSQLEKRGVIVDTYPLFRYAYDSNDKIQDYKHHLNAHIQETRPDIIFWWFIDVPQDVFQFISKENPKRYFVIYNSDDPFNLSKDLFDICKNFDLVLTPSQPSVSKYRRLSHVESASYVPFGADPESFFPLDEETEDYQAEREKYGCDISILADNFYLNREIYPNQRFQAIEFFTELEGWCRTNQLSFRIYGSQVMKEYFPESYHGSVPYHEINSLYNFSKVNLSFHGDCSSGPAPNQHDVAIMMAGGLLVTDHQAGSESFLINGTNCFVLERETWKEQLHSILHNYQIPSIALIKRRARETAMAYSWLNMTDLIVQSYAKKFFDTSLYSTLYRLPLSESTYQHWLREGFEKNQVCYRFDVPESFNHADYTTSACLDLGPLFQREQAYHHWSLNSRCPIYLGTKKESQLDITSLGVTTDQYYTICGLLGKLRTAPPSEKDQALVALGKECSTAPGIKVNEIIRSYLASL